MQWAAIQDWMVEEQILARTGRTVEQHQLLSVASYLDLRDMNLETVGLLLEAANIAYSCLTRVGVQECASPEFYAGLLTQFQALCDMLRTAQQARTGKRQQQAQSTGEPTLAKQHRSRP